VPLSFATRCPQAAWVSEFYDRLNMQEQDEAPSSQQRKNSRRRRSRTAVYVGCNKGIDAVNTLRMLSNDPSVDKFAWRDAFFRNRTVIPGRCRQELEPQYEIVVGDSDGQNSISNNGRVVDTIVHCLEAMPVTARHLADTAQRLGLYKRLRVQNAAVSNLDGWALFPDFPEKVGIESLGIDDCSEKKRVSRTCSNITVATLDSLLLRDKPSEQEEPLYVDFLSIDVEGHDFNVLLGAKRLLPNVRYLEFGTYQNHGGPNDLDLYLTDCVFRIPLEGTLGHSKAILRRGLFRIVWFRVLLGGQGGACVADHRLLVGLVQSAFLV
jgi:FkbM family methyltransferase